MTTGGQRVMWCGYWPISRQYGDIMPSSFHGKMRHEIHLYRNTNDVIMHSWMQEEIDTAHGACIYRVQLNTSHGIFCPLLQRLWVCEATVWSFKKYVCGHITAHLATCKVNCIHSQTLPLFIACCMYIGSWFFMLFWSQEQKSLYIVMWLPVSWENGDPLKWCHGKMGSPYSWKYGTPHLKDVKQMKQGS